MCSACVCLTSNSTFCLNAFNLRLNFIEKTAKMLDVFPAMICFKNSERCETTNKSIEKATTLSIAESAACVRFIAFCYETLPARLGILLALCMYMLAINTIIVY